jgi:isopentenyl-diphosphate delta-isomerase type 1
MQDNKSQISSSAARPNEDYNDPMELLALVDEHDKECGCAPRQLIHQLGLLHRAVHVLVYVDSSAMLIQRRSANKDTYPLHWECVGGHLGPGEAYEAAALREVEEELGVGARELEFLTKIAASEATGREFIQVYRAQVMLPVKPNPEEIAEVRVVAPEELRSMIRDTQEAFSPVFVNTLIAIGLL